MINFHIIIEKIFIIKLKSSKSQIYNEELFLNIHICYVIMIILINIVIIIEEIFKFKVIIIKLDNI